MPQRAVRGGLLWVRPWLQHPRSSIEAYVAHHGLRYVDDDSNADPRFSRNRLRLQVWPALEMAFPQAQSSLAHAAAWAQEAQEALGELAVQDLLGMDASGRALPIAAWAQLSVARRSNALRAWLDQQPGLLWTSSTVQRLMNELDRPGSATWRVGDGQLRRYRGRLSWNLVSVTRPSSSAPLPPETLIRVPRPGEYPLLGWGGVLRVVEVETGGVPLAWMGELVLKPRTGGEKFQAGLGRPPRSLKKQFQAAGVAAWLREGPLVYSGGQLVFVPGLGMDARMLAYPGQHQVVLQWQQA